VPSEESTQLLMAAERQRIIEINAQQLTEAAAHEAQRVT
jgi:hypothetical protein